MTMTQGTLSYLFDEVVSSIAMDQSFIGPSVANALVDMRDMPEVRFRNASFSGADKFQIKLEGQAASEDSIIQQFEKTMVPVAHANSFVITREAAKDEDFGFVARMATTMGESFQQTIESYVGAGINDAATGATYLCEDGLSLANNAHVNKDGGNSQDNLNTSALSMANLTTVRTAAKKFTNYRGTAKTHAKYDLLLTCVDVEETAWQIVNSMGRPDDASHAMNMYNGMFDLLVFDEITSTTFWAIIDSRKMKQNHLWLWRDPYEIFGDGDLFKGLRRMGAYFRSAYGFIDWRWFVLGKA